MAKNNFKELEELYIKERGEGADQTKLNLVSNINLFGFVSNLIDLYIPKAGEVLMTFGTAKNKIKK